MLVLIGLFLGAFGLWAISGRFDEMKIPWLAIAAKVGAICAFPAAIGWMLYRAEIAKPDCPKCGERMTDAGIPKEVGQESRRMYKCRKCGCEFYVPGLSCG